jgi:hypothetical protein
MSINLLQLVILSKAYNYPTQAEWELFLRIIIQINPALRIFLAQIILRRIKAQESNYWLT